MQKEKCSSCGNVFSTYTLRNGKCRICLRKEDNAYDLDKLTDEEYEEVTGSPRFAGSNFSKDPDEASDREKDKVLKMFSSMTTEEKQHILKLLSEPL